jgi:hypothetical protein
MKESAGLIEFRDELFIVARLAPNIGEFGFSILSGAQCVNSVNRCFASSTRDREIVAAVPKPDA